MACVQGREGGLMITALLIAILAMLVFIVILLAVPREIRRKW